MIRITRPRNSYKGDLVLQERSRALTPADLNLLPFDERLNLVQMARGRQKSLLILDAPDPEDLVPRLAVQDFYLMTREVGVEDLDEILALATTEQWTSLIDFDGWPGDEINAPAARRWLELLLRVGDGKFSQAIREFDLDLLILSLAKQFKILHAPGDIEDEDLNFEVVRNSGGYVLEFFDPEESQGVAAFLDRMHNLEPEHYYQVMEGVRWEGLAQIEEDVYQSRCGRLLDLGFDEPHVAKAVYSRIDCENFVKNAARKKIIDAPHDEPVQALRLLGAAPPGGLLAAVMAAGISERLANELLLLVNKVLSADCIDHSNEKELRDETSRVYGLLNLALESLCNENVADAARVLEEYYVEDLFRYAFSLTLELQMRARKIASTPVAPFLDGPYRAGVEILCRKHPGFYNGMSQAEMTGDRPFSGKEDLLAAQRWLHSVEAQLQYFLGRAPFPLPAVADFDLSGCEPASFSDLTLSDLFLTALANHLLGGDFTPAPVSSAQLAALHKLVTVDGGLDSRLKGEIVKDFTAEIAELKNFVDWSLDLWEEGFCSVDEKELDPRYISGLIVRI